MRPNPGSNGGGSGVKGVSASRFISAMAAVQESKASQRRLDRIARAQIANIFSLVFDSVLLTITVTITVTGPEFGQVYVLISARIRATTNDPRIRAPTKDPFSVSTICVRHDSPDQALCCERSF